MQTESVLCSSGQIGSGGNLAVILERKSGVRRIEARKFARHVADLLIYWLQVIRISLLLLLQLVVQFVSKCLKEQPFPLAKGKFSSSNLYSFSLSL